MSTRTDSPNLEESLPAVVAVEAAPPAEHPEPVASSADDDEWGSTPILSTDGPALAEAAASASAQPDPAEVPETTSQTERPPQADDEPSGLAAIEAELAAEAGTEEEDEVAAPTGTGWQGELPDLLMRIVDARINVWKKLLEMESQRGEMIKQARAREIRDEVSRQTRELKHNPSAEILQTSLHRQQALLQNPVIKSEVPPPDPKSKDPEADQDQLYRNAIQMGIGQIALLLQRIKLDAAIPAAAITATVDEPLVILSRKHGLGIDSLMGWTYYALGLQQRIDGYAGAEKEYETRLASARAEDKESNKGLGSLFRGSNKEEQVGHLDPGIRSGLRAAARELQSVEPRLTDMFWSFYEDLALAFVQNKFDEDEAPVARAFLRYGLVSVHPGLISAEKLEFIAMDVSEDVQEWSNTPQATHVVYADEYITAVVEQDLTVSPDENLELNGRGSEVWKADRVWRQAVICRTRTDLFGTRLAELKTLIDKKQADCDKRMERAQKLRATPKKVQEAKQLEKQALTIKPAIARLRHGAEHIENKIIPKTAQQAEEAAKRLEEAVAHLTGEMVVRREAKFIRYMARLVGRLKEPFAQFVLRDHFKPGGSDHNSRKVVLAAIRKLESGDRRLLHHVLMPNKRLDRQVSVRMSPTFLLPPGRGQMGLVVSHRKWDDNGRIVLPLLACKAGELDNLLTNLMADFRWDCSKEEAGMDWIVADALCAAYAAARWNVRKLSEKSQKMMSFDFKLKDKGNFRIHYGLYVTSAAQGGRLLFSRSDEVYKVMVRHIGLPPGVDVLKRD